MEADDQIITFKTYYDPMLAHIVRTRLEDSGISCFIADENMIGINPLYNNALGGIKLKIFARDLEKCEEILSADESLSAETPVEIDDEINPPMVCPHCGSTNVRYGSATEKRFDWLGIAMAFIFTTYPFHSRHAWHCFNCGKDFKVKE